MQKFKFDRWVMLNLILPLAPLLLRLFILFIADRQKIIEIKIIDIPELLFFSIFTCVVALDINDNVVSRFENFVRWILYGIVVIDLVTLGICYCGSTGDNAGTFIIISASCPAVIAFVYKYNFIKTSKAKGGSKNV